MSLKSYLYINFSLNDFTRNFVLDTVSLSRCYFVYLSVELHSGRCHRSITKPIIDLGANGHIE